MAESTRPRVLSEKGLQYHLDLKAEQKERVYKRVQAETQRIKSQISQETVDKSAHVLYSHWLTLYEQLLEVYEDYNALLPDESRIADREEWMEPKERELLQFKSEFESFFTASTGPTFQQEMPQENDEQSIKSGSDASRSSKSSIISAKNWQN